MFKKLIINVNEHETRVALLEEGTIAELFIERMDDSEITGNVYKGKVQRVLPGMQAAFVDIGINQAAFIYVNDVLGNHVREFERLFDQNADAKGDSDYEEKPSPFPDFNDGIEHIEDLLTEGQEILVQMVKSPLGTKGARVTSRISLPGKFLVLMPTSSHIGVSRRIEDEAERNRLKSIVESIRRDNQGYIVRTAAEGIGEEKLANEMVFLKKLWDNIQKKLKTSSAPSLLHQELNVILRAVRDLMTHEVESLVIDNRSAYESVLSFLEILMPGLKSAVEPYEGVEPIFDAYNLEGDISRALKRKVWLKSGGYIVIEQTEALVAIDVNTGRYVGKHNPEETILKTNLEAVKEIAYQIRLRDIGGIIIIDFIDMEKKSHQEKVFNAFQEALKKDRSKTHILPISELGLVQMTRKRTRKSLAHSLCEPCLYCDGEGQLLSRQSICYTIYRDILRGAHDIVGVRMTLRVNPEIAELLHGEENHLIRSLETRLQKQVEIYPNPQFHMEKFDVLEMMEH
ncbi:MAG: ribonuclease G [Deltaproteobacteria bacterium RBG_13_49_15]|nr:MAG: ribonuclease G [Deltaproteobacteria bacterium RBG_13_49_15]